MGEGGCGPPDPRGRGWGWGWAGWLAAGWACVALGAMSCVPGAVAQGGGTVRGAVGPQRGGTLPRGGADIEPVFLAGHPASAGVPHERRVVMRTAYGDMEFALFPEVAPVTVAHVLDLIRFGLYDTNNIFRIDKGFVAQVSEVTQRRVPVDVAAMEVATKNVPGEFRPELLRHVRGVLSMGRRDDPDSGTSSFSILLGDAPHLDGQYTAFGCATKGDDVLRILETLPTRTEGMFVMPLHRVEVEWFRLGEASVGEGSAGAGGQALPKQDERIIPEHRGQVPGGVDLAGRGHSGGMGNEEDFGEARSVVADENIVGGVAAAAGGTAGRERLRERGYPGIAPSQGYLVFGFIACVVLGVYVGLRPWTDSVGRRLGHRSSRKRGV